ncbi:MAG TPA: Minf_1886 family protein [Verrucomicrobiae bacterium]|nr:Minf_1886 family protein [Verrucomicrobiae bacterium]
MQEISFERALDVLRAKDPRYEREAYLFVREALDHTQQAIRNHGRKSLRHVTGQELLGGIREFGLKQFGPMTMMLFEEWGIRSCEDFGEIVFNLVETGVLAKTPQDSRADFAGGYNFFEAFRKPYLPKAKPARFATAAAPLWDK